MFQIVPHTADVGIRLDAADVNELFSDAGRAFF
jgi:SHS2 domain-containing protein